MARVTLSRNAARTISGWLSTRDTVAAETLAARATSSILARRRELGMVLGAGFFVISFELPGIERACTDWTPRRATQPTMSEAFRRVHSFGSHGDVSRGDRRPRLCLTASAVPVF